MKKINILSEELANKIAAGEVVERPASVVKELLENSIDANSSNIKIVIRDFGIEEIRIIDNGDGISNEDMEIAFLRHATSKIKSTYDLFHIETLGFRGEALASISSVSNVEVKSCASEPQGKILKLQGGKVVKNEFYAPIKGTDIKISNLFYNTPARLKYLKNPYTEQANINNVVQKLALANPHIAFELIVDGKIVLKTYGDNDTHKLIAKIYNVEIAKNMIEFNGINDDYEIFGYTSKPEETRANKSYISIFINGRYIKNYQLQNSIVDAYGNFLMKNRYPICTLNIKMDSALVDVNVHPTKQEVRLSKETELKDLIKDTIRKTLSNNTYIPSGINYANRSNKENIEQLSYLDSLDNNYVVRETTVQNYNYDYEPYKKNIASSYDDNEEKYEPYNDFSNLEFINNDEKKETNNFLNSIDFQSVLDGDTKDEDGYFISEITNENLDNIIIDEIIINKTLPELTILSQIFKTYILAQTGDELYLIDQHAAQERYNYEKIKKDFSNNIKYKKQLLIPITFDFNQEEIGVIKELVKKLEDLGISLEEFGENNYVLREYPTWIQDNPESIIKDIIERLKLDKNLTVEDLADDIIAMSSCKASIKANQILSIEEMKKVIEDLYSCDNPFTCPHGRPIMSKLDKKDLEKMFKRIV